MFLTHSNRRKARPGHRDAPRRSRAGTAAVELAVCLPLLVAVVFGSIEACSIIFLKESLQTTAYELARASVATGSKAAHVHSYGQELFALRNINGGKATLDPPVLHKLDTGALITVTVRAPIGSNRIGPDWFFGTGELTVTCTMLKE